MKLYIYFEVIPTRDNTCKGCFFYENYKTCDSTIRDIVGICYKEYRTDNTAVIFRNINNKIMKNITLEEARELYKQGSMAKEIALRYFIKEEILNDYNLITSLPEEVTCTTAELYAKLKTVYKEISKGREIFLTKTIAYVPTIIFAHNMIEDCKGKFVGKVLVDYEEFYIFITTNIATYKVKLGYKNADVYYGYSLLNDNWIFKERGQAEHFVKFFYKELILLSLADEHKVTFI